MAKQHPKTEGLAGQPKELYARRSDVAFNRGAR